MKPITAQYIESGTFVAGEETVFDAGIERDEDVVVLKKSDFENLKRAVEETKRQLDMRFKNRSNHNYAGGGKKLWEQQVLWFANTALGFPAGKFPNPTRW